MDKWGCNVYTLTQIVSLSSSFKSSKLFPLSLHPFFSSGGNLYPYVAKSFPICFWLPLSALGFSSPIRACMAFLSTTSQKAWSEGWIVKKGSGAKRRLNSFCWCWSHCWLIFSIAGFEIAFYHSYHTVCSVHYVYCTKYANFLNAWNFRKSSTQSKHAARNMLSHNAVHLT